MTPAKQEHKQPDHHYLRSQLLASIKAEYPNLPLTIGEKQMVDIAVRQILKIAEVRMK